MRFNVFIDESGEAGIAKVRSASFGGASPYFVLGAVVCEEAHTDQVREEFFGFKSKLRKKSWKHATDLSHAEKVYLARELGKLRVRFFSVISNKETLKGYKDEIESDPQKFYNKCTQYLLEQICQYLIGAGAKEGDIRVIFEERNHDYGKMISFLSRVKENPLHQNSRSLRVLNPTGIIKRKKGEDPMLDIADFISHSVYCCVNKTPMNFGIPEPRYFFEISSRFAPDSNGKVLGCGLKCVHAIEKLALDEDIEEAFKMTTGVLPDRMK